MHYRDVISQLAYKIQNGGNDEIRNGDIKGDDLIDDNDMEKLESKV